MTASAPTVRFDETAVDAIFADLDSGHGPGCAVGISVGGTPVYRKGFGLANMEQPIVLSPATRMPIGSMTKHFACLAFMLLAEEGRAGPDDRLGNLLPELHPVTHRVTMRQLMGHLGGLRDAYEIITLFSGMTNPVTAAEALSLYRDIDDVNFAPGIAWSYNNGGYVILAAVIERLTGQTLREVLRQKIFEPAGLRDTLLRPFERDFLPGAATLHAIGPDGAFEKGFRFLEGGGQGGIYSTVDDMLRWLRHIGSPAAGSAEIWRLMTAPMSLSQGDTTRYGMGLIASEHRGVGIIHHSGSVVGGNSQMIKAPDVGLDIVVMVNRGDVSAATLASRVFEACLPDLPAAPAAARVEPVRGLFRSPESGRVVQLFARGGQQIASIDGVDMLHHADADGVLSPPFFGVPERQSIRLIGQRENASAIELAEFGSAETFVALRPTPDADAGRIAGRYRSEAIGAELIVGESGNLRSNGRFGSALYAIEPLADDLWRGRLLGALPVAAILSFDDDGQALRVSSGFERGVTFRRV